MALTNAPSSVEPALRLLHFQSSLLWSKRTGFYIRLQKPAYLAQLKQQFCCDLALSRSFMSWSFCGIREPASMRLPLLAGGCISCGYASCWTAALTL